MGLGPGLGLELGHHTGCQPVELRTRASAVELHKLCVGLRLGWSRVPVGGKVEPHEVLFEVYLGCYRVWGGIHLVCRRVGSVGPLGYRMVQTEEHQGTQQHPDSLGTGQVEASRKDTLVVETSVRILNTVYNGYSDILDIVIILSLSIFPHLHIRHTKFIGYSDIMAIVIIWS